MLQIRISFSYISDLILDHSQVSLGVLKHSALDLWVYYSVLGLPVLRLLNCLSFNLFN